MEAEGPALTIGPKQSPLPRPSPASTLFSLLVGLVGLGILVYRVASDWQAQSWLPVLLFAGLSLLIQRSSFHFGSPIVHSLAGVIDLSAVLALGPSAGAVVAALSGLAYLGLSALRRQRFTRHDLLEIPLFNAGLKALMALLGGALYQALAGPLPLGSDGRAAGQSLDGYVLLAVGALSLLWFLVDHVGWGLLDYLEGGSEQLHAFVRSAIPHALLIELLPLPSGLVVALVYAYLGWAAFTLVAVAIFAVAVVTQRWADARNELVQRVAELSTVEQVSLAIAQARLDVDAVCRLMFERASQLVDTTIFHLGLFDGDDYIIKLWVRDGRLEPPQTFHLEPGVGLVGWMRQTGQPIRVRDFERELDSLPARPAYVSDNPPRSALFVPLMAGETVIGTLSVQSFRRDAYGESDLRVLSAMANQAALAIQKARLYAQEQKRVRQLETIGQVASQVSATLELDELFQRVVHLVRENFGYYHVAIFSADRERQAVTFQASASAGAEDVQFDVAWGDGFIGWVVAHEQAVIVNDVEHDTRYRCVEALDGTRAELAAPLLLEGELVGVLDVQSDQLAAFGPDDLFIVETLGAQIALAIQEARLYEAERQQAWFSTALLQVVEAISRLSDMDAVLTTIVRLTPLLAGVDRCALLLWDPDSEAFVPAQMHGLASSLRDTFSHLLFATGDLPALDLMRLEKAPLLVSVAEDEQLLPADLIEMFDIREMLLLPLLAQGELQGAMMVDYAGAAHSFSERMIEMLTGIAHQAAMVIQSARLVQAQREEAYVSMALLQVAEAVSRSTDLDELLETVVRITPMLVGVEGCALFLWDPQSAAFVPARQYAFDPERRAVLWQPHSPEQENPFRELVAGKPFVTLPDLTGEQTRSSSPVPTSGRDGKPRLDGSSLLALPLATKGEVLGAMVVDYRGPQQHFAQRSMNILTGIAGQAAIAVENDRLLKEAAEQERMKQELEVAQRIQASFLPECCPRVPGWELAAVWRSARQVGGDFYDFIPLPADREQAGAAGNRMGLVIADVADKGVPAALFMALSRTLVRTMAIDGRPPSEAIARANDLILADARSGLFVTLFYVILDPGSMAISFVNAGHMPPLLVHASGGPVEELRTDGMALGVLQGMEFEQCSARVSPGDSLVLYTDGVTEASNVQQEMFGRERLSALVQAHRTCTAEELVQFIDGAVAEFVGDAPQFDDFTLVVAKRVTA